VRVPAAEEIEIASAEGLRIESMTDDEDRRDIEHRPSR
jgi:hypothetical protein